LIYESIGFILLIATAAAVLRLVIKACHAVLPQSSVTAVLKRFGFGSFFGLVFKSTPHCDGCLVVCFCTQKFCCCKAEEMKRICESTANEAK
jgi:hypothetical protein